MCHHCFKLQCLWQMKPIKVRYLEIKPIKVRYPAPVPPVSSASAFTKARLPWR